MQRKDNGRLLCNNGETPNHMVYSDYVSSLVKPDNLASSKNEMNRALGHLCAHIG